MTTRRITTTLAVLALAGLVGACSGSGSDDDDGVASVSDDEETAGEETEAGQALFDWVDCMAEEGVELPEPTRDADGNLVIVGNGIAIGYGMPTDFGPIAEEDMKAADAVCGIPPIGGAGVVSDETRQAEQEMFLAFSECMREQGVEDFPDPDFAEVEAGKDSDDPGDGISPIPPISEFGAAGEAAAEACRDIIESPGGAARSGEGDGE